MATGFAILVNISKKLIDPESLDKEQRRLVVAYLDGPRKLAGELRPVYTQEEMAGILHVSRQTINTDLRAIRRHFGAQVLTTDIKEVAGELHRSKQIAQYHARLNENWALYWAIESSYIEALMRMGIIQREKVRLDVSGGLTVEHAFSQYSPEQTRNLLDIIRDDRAGRN